MNQQIHSRQPLIPRRTMSIRRTRHKPLKTNRVRRRQAHSVTHGHGTGAGGDMSTENAR